MIKTSEDLKHYNKIPQRVSMYGQKTGKKGSTEKVVNYVVYLTGNVVSIQQDDCGITYW